ncbi:MAG: glycosyl hydrolase 115 family protein [Acetatifactor sp.]|nr:glycosyl hydrolase 115 family protein [Acetatifactor sp.]
MEMKLVESGKALPILVESQAFEGVRLIAETVAEDIRLVTDISPELLAETALEDSIQKLCKGMIFCATVGHSPLLERLEAECKFSSAELKNKREVFKIVLVEQPFSGVEKALIICGSDKRGTIYGMFTLSEYLGVTPLVYWGDAAPAKVSEPVVKADIEVISKEPSVRYRGFFINDEWPCFGNWVNDHFGGFNADAYRHVFEFLLRMKGNYLWPAMWSSSFPLDGPGSRNEELADIYGVVMGYSHHEPCLRASEEWDKVRGEGTRYGNAWNFYTNEQGLLNYWEDSLKRSGKYENVITIGMRGERDTSMLGENATVQENVELLKDIIRKQRQLIKEHVNPDLSQVPQMLALYKEVEAYFYGDENTPGLKDWEELDGVICMLCEDNFGHLRTLPEASMRNRPGGFGMYYHFDYHGGPISYEWVDSTPLSKTWEQMCMAYEYGIRDLWIVNVGDLKFHEVPLTYFLALAYDYEKWGYSNPESYREFTAQWAKKCFPKAGDDLQKKIVKVFTEYIDINHLRRPEAQNADIYHPCHFQEADRMWRRAEAVEKLSAEVYDKLSAEEKDAWYSMVHFSATASMNLLKMNLIAAKNHRYAKQGRTVANHYIGVGQSAIVKDRELIEEFGRFKDGKWDGMQLAPHIGFTRWNEDGCQYPYICLMEPVQKPRMSVSRCDGDVVCVKNYGGPSAIKVEDFRSAGCEKVYLEVANDGVGFIRFQIRSESGKIPDWLEVSPVSGEVEQLQQIELRCLRDKLPAGTISQQLLISDGETTVAVDITASAPERMELPVGTFLPMNGVVTMDADHYGSKKDTGRGEFRTIRGYGRYGVGVKVFPSTADFSVEEERPELVYRFWSRDEGNYRVELLAAPTNSPVNGRPLRVTVDNGQGEQQVLTLVEKDFLAGDNRDARWCQGVLDQIRVVQTVMHFGSGVQQLKVGALEAGLVLERVRVYPDHMKLPVSYLGPEESWRKQ